MIRDNKEQVLKALQEFITTRESLQKLESTNMKNYLFGVSWTLTQLHIVALLQRDGMLNNTSLAEKLNVSKPAITKAMKNLLEHHIVAIKQMEGNKKEIHYILTDKGNELALLHEQLHEEAKSQYLKLLESFSDEQLETINTFLYSLTEHLKMRMMK